MAYGFTHFELIGFFVVVTRILPTDNGVVACREMNRYTWGALGLPGAA